MGLARTNNNWFLSHKVYADTCSVYTSQLQSLTGVSGIQPQVVHQIPPPLQLAGASQQDTSTQVSQEVIPPTTNCSQEMFVLLKKKLLELSKNFLTLVVNYVSVESEMFRVPLWMLVC